MCKETSNFVMFSTQMRYFYLFISIVLIVSCSSRKPEQEMTPWGTVVGASDETLSDTAATDVVSLNDIVSQGEMIMLTVNGPDTYYDYHGHGMGLHYLLCEKLAKRLGVKLRVEVCKDSTDLVSKLSKGEGDIIACPIKDKSLTACGPDWAVLPDNKELASAIRSWYKPELIDATAKEQKTLLANGGVIRHVYAPMINRQKGLISRWDGLFQKYAPQARIDWRLMAAQCYQESCFDPKAHSFAGACGLMQIMPSTARQLGLAESDIYTPEKNIAAASRYMAQLLNDFSDISPRQEQVCFALAAYNGGKGHVRDAMALAKKHGRSAYHWNSVKEFILKLAQREYYTDPVVKHGYMRGSETADYVDRILKRWADYGGRPGRLASGGPSMYDGPSTQPTTTGISTPQRATKKHRFH